MVWVGVACGLVAPARAADVPDVRPQAVAPQVWFVQGLSALGNRENQNFISNAGFVITDDSVVVIDALGSPALAERLIAQIKAITPKPVSHVIVTHYHADHIYGLQAFKAVGARIVGHRAALEYLNSDTAALRLVASRGQLSPWINDQTRLLPADDWIDGSVAMKIGGTVFDIRAVGPAHTPEDLVVYVAKHRVLFVGDLVFRSRIPFVGQADSGQWIKALDVLLGFDATALIPGHGPLSNKARDDMQLTRNYLAYLRQTMGKAASNMEPFDEAYKATDWSAFEALPLFQQANRMNAYNTYLLMERQAQ